MGLVVERVGIERLHHESRGSDCSTGGGLAGDPGCPLPQDGIIQGAGGCRMVSDNYSFSARKTSQLFVNFFCLLSSTLRALKLFEVRMTAVSRTLFHIEYKDGHFQ